MHTPVKCIGRSFHLLRNEPGLSLLDPTNQTAMTKVNWGGAKPGLGGNHTFLQNPPASGGIESNPAYDPNQNLVFVATYNEIQVDSVHGLTGPGIAYGDAGLNFFTTTNIASIHKHDNLGSEHEYRPARLVL